VYVLLEFWQKMVIPIMNPLSWFVITGNPLAGMLHIHSFLVNYTAI